MFNFTHKKIMLIFLGFFLSETIIAEEKLTQANFKKKTFELSKPPPSRQNFLTDPKILREFDTQENNAQFLVLYPIALTFKALGNFFNGPFSRDFVSMRHLCAMKKGKKYILIPKYCRR